MPIREVAESRAEFCAFNRSNPEFKNMKCFFISGNTEEDNLCVAGGLSELRTACVELGRSVSSNSAEIFVCRPFDDPPDSFVFRGAALEARREGVSEFISLTHLGFAQSSIISYHSLS